MNFRAGQTYSIVVETDNLSTISREEFGGMLSAMAGQIAAATEAGYAAFPEVILVHDGNPEASPNLFPLAVELAPALSDLAKLRELAVPEGRYYMLKNAGAETTGGEILVFLDSDVTPESGWLVSLLSPFQDPEAVVAIGYSYLEFSDWVSRTMALIWVLPLRQGDEKHAERRPLSVNNCAFRRDWFLEHRFAIDTGFKVDCAILMRFMLDQGITIYRTPAYGRHLPFRGWRFLCWRAMVTGRDTDRKYEIMKSASRFRRVLFAWRRIFTHAARIPRRVLSRYSLVGLEWKYLPLSVAFGWGFYALAGMEQMRRALGLARDIPEQLPEWVEQS